MATVRFIHTADLHLDAPFSGIAQWDEELADHLRKATFRSFDRIMRTAVDREVDLVLISGDVFDGETASLAAQVHFVQGLEMLAEHGIAVYVICGNHDPFPSWLSDLRFPSNVQFFPDDGVSSFRWERPGKPAVDIYGVSYRNAELRENLAHYFERGSDPAPLSFAMLHGTVGSPGPHRQYAPFGIGDVLHKGFDYWALGHIHKRSVIRERDPAIVYPGNIQGRHPNETGPKGCYLVELGPDRPPELSFITTHEVRYETLRVDLEDVADPVEMTENAKALLEGLRDHDRERMIVRLSLEGRTPLHARLSAEKQMEDLRSSLQQHFKGLVRLVKIIDHSKPAIDEAQLRQRNDLVGELWRAMEELEGDEEKLRGLIEEFRRAFGGNVARPEWTRLEGEETEKDLLKKAKWHLIRPILDQEENPGE